MKKYILMLVLVLLMMERGQAQVQFTERLEVETEWMDNDFIVLPLADGTVAFRMVVGRGFNATQKLQYFTSDINLNTTGIVEIPIKYGFRLKGFDYDNGLLYLLFQKGEALSSDKLILEVNPDTIEVKEIPIGNILDMDLQEFLIMDEKAILMGMMDSRPAIQVVDITNQNVYTVQDIYANEVNILQIRKDSQLKFFDVMTSRRDRFKKKLISILTFDEEGNKLREVRIDELDSPQLEIVEGVLTPTQNYNQALIGPYGQRKRESYKGIYLSQINEFGEYKIDYFSLKEFENFYNYLPEKQKKRRLRSLERAIEKDKNITIPNTLVTREVIAGQGYFLVYNDYFMASTSRFRSRDLIYNPSFYPYSPLSLRNHVIPGGYPWFHPSMRNGSNNQQYKYLAAQFLLLDTEGNLIWDNSLSLENFNTANPNKFGEVSFDGVNLFYMYLEEEKLKLSHILDGEIRFENEGFGIQLLAKNERIKDTQKESLSLHWWYDDYFLLSGKQRVRFQDENMREQVKEVFFLTKILVQPRELTGIMEAD